MVECDDYPGKWVYYAIGKSVFCQVRNRFCENVVTAEIDPADEDLDRMFDVSSHDEEESESSQSKRRRVGKAKAEETETQIEEEENPWEEIADDEERVKEYPEFLGLMVRVREVAGAQVIVTQSPGQPVASGSVTKETAILPTMPTAPMTPPTALTTPQAASTPQSAASATTMAATA